MRSKCDENHKSTKQSYYRPLIKQANTNMSHNIREKKIIFADKHVLSLSHMSIFEMILFFQCKWQNWIFKILQYFLIITTIISNATRKCNICGLNEHSDDIKRGILFIRISDVVWYEYDFIWCILWHICHNTKAVTKRSSVKRSILKNFAKFIGKHLCQNMQASLIKKRLWCRYSPVNFAKFLRTTFS